MTNNKLIAEAQKSMGEILAAMKIEAVVSIDDNYGLRGFSELIGIVDDELMAAPDRVKEVFPKVNFDVPPEVYRGQLQTEWDLLSQDEQQALYDRLTPNAPVDKTLSVLKQICPVPVKEYSPSQWDKSYRQDLQSIMPGHFFLVLFDQNLEHAKNYSDTGPTSGLGLAQRLLNSDYRDRVICGVLSHMFEVKSEMLKWREWISGHQFEPSTILPISKGRLTVDNPLQFVDAIKATVLNGHYETLKTFMKDALARASDKALNHLDELNPYAFNHIVISSSRTEGVWELETLLRLFRIYHKDEIHRAVLQEPERIDEVNKHIEASRIISGIHTETDDYMIHVWDLAHQERFESIETVAQSELQTGDIFIDPNFPKNKYILLAQPCDLSVRLDGERTLDRQPVPLVPFETAPKDLDKKPAGFWNTHAVIPYIDNTGERGCVKFQEVCWVNLDVLELSVFDPDSKCKYVRGALVTLPSQLPEGYKMRLTQLSSNWQYRAEKLHGIYARLESMGEDIFNELWNSILLYTPFQSLISSDERKDNEKTRSPQMPFTLMKPVTYSDDEGIFDFHLERAGRYREPVVNRLLSAFSKYLSRDADEVDFGRKNKADNKTDNYPSSTKG